MQDGEVRLRRQRIAGGGRWQQHPVPYCGEQDARHSGKRLRRDTAQVSWHLPRGIQLTLDATAAGTVNVTMSKSGSPGYASSAGATLAAAGDLATVSIVDYVTVVGGVGGAFATLTFAPDAAVGIKQACVLVDRVCGC